ncbi:MAG: hypothetical protein WDM91_15770 [Rhizomicrobium sp.]
MDETEYKDAREGKTTVQMRLTIPSRAYDYLTHLKSSTVLGATENDVAAHLLIQLLHEWKMKQFREPPAQTGEPPRFSS